MLVLPRGFMGAGGSAFSTWNPSDKAGTITLTGGNLIATKNASGAGLVRGTLSKSSGKWYYEVTSTVQGGGDPGIGVASSASSTTLSVIGFDTTSGGYYYNTSSPSFVANGSSTNIAIGPPPTPANGDIYGVAIDVGAHKFYISRNGTYLNSGNPASGTNGVDYITTSPVFPTWVCSSSATASVTLNVGATAFNTAAPSGFLAWG